MIVVFQKKIVLLWIMEMFLALSEDEASSSWENSFWTVYIDGNGIGDIGNIVLRDRRIFLKKDLLL